jgi:hypothetical protein
MAREKGSGIPYNKKIRPGLRGKALRNIKISDDFTIEKGSAIIIQPLDPEKSPQAEQRFKLTTYEADTTNKSDLPESQRNIKAGSSFEIVIDEPQKTFIYEEHYQISNEPLFPENSPSLADVSQNQIPNCFLLSIIQAILNQPNGADFIRGMMTANEDGTTTVRLFDPKTAEPTYINVPTAILVDKKGPINQHKALWVHVLESAYAAMGIGTFGNVDASASSVFSGGGMTSTATAILTGFPETKSIHLTTEDHLSLFRIDQSEIGQIESMRVFPDDLVPQAKKDEIFKAVLLLKLNTIQSMDSSIARHDAYTDYMNYFDFYQSHKNEINEILNDSEKPEPRKLYDLIDLAKNFHGAIRLFNKSFNYLNVPTDEKTVRGSVSAFSGYYNPQQQKAYKDMEEAIKNKQLITSDTATKFKNPVPGLRNEHSYTVLNVFSREERAGENKVSVSYVQLRNPWGSTGRVYKQKENSLEFHPEEDQKAAIFEIELSDFCNNFSHIGISPSVHHLLQYDKQQQELRESITEIQRYFNDNSKDITISNLLEYKENYDEYVEKLLALEMLHLQTLAPKKLAEIQPLAEHFFSTSTISEEERQEILIKIMMESRLQPPFYSGSEKQKYLQLYNLLKLSWLKNQDKQDNEAIKKAESNIVDNASYEFCSVLKSVKSGLDIFRYQFAQNVKIDLANINILTEKVEEQVKDINLETFPQLLSSLILLQTLQAKIVNQNTFLKKLGLGFDKKLDMISNRVLHIAQLLTHQYDYTFYKENFEKQRDEALSAVAEAFGSDVLDIEKFKHIMSLIENITKNDRALEDLKEVTMELKAPNDSDHELPEQAELVGYLEQLIAAAQALMDLVVTIIAGTIEFLFAAKEENGYFVEKKDEVEEEPYIGPFSRA